MNESAADIEAIKALKARYFRLLDTADWVGWGDVFTEDATIDVRDDAGEERGVVHGRDAIVTSVRDALAGARTVHHGHMPEITITGRDRATGIWAMADIVEYPTDPPAGLRGYGHYHETYRRDGGTWRIESMRLTRLRIDPLD